MFLQFDYDGVQSMYLRHQEHVGLFDLGFDIGLTSLEYQSDWDFALPIEANQLGHV
jgi:hypothetical protein